MPTKLVRLREDDILVEVEVPEEQAREISSRNADAVDSTINKIYPVLVSACRPIINVWKEVKQEIQLEQAEIELGFSFEGEGNLYIAKTKATATLTVKLVVKPKESFQ
ncbi:MAG: hypothetical protein HC827_07435 [Cyanobacteria bacterium RM1_2_2]|nr:hypothetical protein [Cyanobacteria bacterium RM1_2_2]